MDTKKIEEHIRSSSFERVALDYQIEGVTKLFESAAVQGNNTMMEQFRQQLHELMDRKLDVIAAQSSLVRTMFGGK